MIYVKIRENQIINEGGLNMSTDDFHSGYSIYSYMECGIPRASKIFKREW